MPSAPFPFHSLDAERDSIPRFFKCGVGIYADKRPVAGLLWFEFDRRCVSLSARYGAADAATIVIDRDLSSLYLPVPVTATHGQLADLIADPAITQAVTAVYDAVWPVYRAAALASLRAAYAKHFREILFTCISREPNFTR